MALTITGVTGAHSVQGNKRRRVYDITFDSSYPTGGEPLAASDVGLKKIETLETAGGKTSNGASALPLIYDYTNSKIQAYRYDGASAGKAYLEEVANAVDLSTFSARVVVVGY